MKYPKYLLLMIGLLSFHLSGQAQFRKLLNKVKEKAVEAVTGESTTTDTGNAKAQPAPVEEDAEEPAPSSTSTDEPEDEPEMKLPPPIQFPHTGHTVKAMHAMFAPVIDGDIQKILNTPQGKYGISQARQKGLKGSDEEIFRQLLDLDNAKLMEEINKVVEEKFPEKTTTESSSGPATKMGNPAWGGISTPSLFYKFMIGEFDIWMTDRYIKTAMNRDHPTYAAMWGVNAAGIIDVQKRISYSIASVLGVNYTMIKQQDTAADKPYGAIAVLPLIKENYLGIKGVKIEKGGAVKFGEYNCVSEKIIIPVQPYIDKDSHTKDKYLLLQHDMLSNREDYGANNGRGNWDPDFKIIYEYYFTHDFDKYLPESIRRLAMKSNKGLCVGAAIKDENGNSAVFRITNVQTDQDIDEGEFQVPPDYPVMTEDELHKAIRKKMGQNLKQSLLKGALHNDSDSNP